MCLSTPLSTTTPCEPDQMSYHYSEVPWDRLMLLIELAGRDAALKQKLEEEAKYRISRGWTGREWYLPLRVMIP